MEVSNNLFQNGNIEIVFLPVLLELFNLVIMTAGTCLMYLGIEISHPVYGVLFSNLILTIISSLINVLVFPFVKTINYNTLVNGNNSVCLFFQCSCWCVLSALRYLYIIHKTWIHKTFPKTFPLFLLSLFGVVILFSFGSFTMISVAIQLGWPTVKISNMPWKDQSKFI